MRMGTGIVRQDRQDANPIFGTRKLKLGTFQSNLEAGGIMADLEGRLEISWPNTVALAQMADEMEFEALLPIARWKGFGGATNPQGPGFEAFAWAAGIAGATRKAGVLATSHITLNHPIVAAKQSTVIDHISNGRFTLNIVNGWNFPEMEMFGLSCSTTRSATAAPKSGSRWSSASGPRRRRSTTRASTTRSTAGTCSPSRCRSPIRRS